MSFKIRYLALAVAAVAPIASNAAGLDRSTQPSWSFTQDGTFAYVEHITIDPKVKGKDSSGNKVPDMADDYHFLNYGAKADVNDKVSLGVFFDQPWGADAAYSGNNNFVSPATAVIDGLFAQANVAGVTNVASANAYITSATQQLAAGQAQVNAGQAQLQTQIAAGQAQIAQAQAQLAQAQTLLASLPAGSPQAQAVQAQITAGQEQLRTQAAQGQARIAAAQQQLAASQAQINAGQAKLTQLKGLTATAAGLANDTSSTRVKVKSQNFTGILGLKFGDKNQFQVYGGPALEKLEGEVHLRGDAYSSATGYDASIPSNTAYGWLAGLAYSKPEIALKAALTYRSEIDHDVKLAENLPIAPLRGIAAQQTNKNTITMPQSVNLDFQTGLNPTTLLTAKVRWVPWSDFAIVPKAYTELSKKAVDANGKQLYPKGLPLVAYDKDGWTAEVGIGKKLSPKWAVSGSVGWDSGAGNPVTTLGPVEGNWNVGLGAKYNITPEWAVSAGAKYLLLGDAKAKVPTGVVVGNFEDNDAWVYGLRLTYQKK